MSVSAERDMRHPQQMQKQAPLGPNELRLQMQRLAQAKGYRVKGG